MKILVVSEKFDNGGLETQIKTYYESLHKNVKMIFAFSKYTEKIKLKNAKIYTGFHFSYVDSIKEFCEDVNKLVEIIRKEKIDIVHVHPYYSFFSAYFASQITNTKLFYTYHGLSSFNFLKTHISQVIFQYAFESLGVAAVLSVSNDGLKCFRNLAYERAYLLPNPIDSKRFPIADVKQNGHWALISRLDIDKIAEIKLLISNLKKLRIRKLDIYGSGSEEQQLKKFLIDNKLDNIITLKGYTYDIYNDLNGKYSGVIGIGRSLLEAMYMGYPTILIGYNKLTGFVSKKVFDEIKDNNFSNKDLNEENYKAPSMDEIKQIRDVLREDFNSIKLSKKYLDIINENNSVFRQNIVELYKKIEELSQQRELENCSFHKERLIYNLLYDYIGKYTLSPITYNTFVNANLNYELFDISLIKINEMKGMIKND